MTRARGAAALAVLAALGGCGGGNDAPPRPAAPTQPPAAAGAEPAPPGPTDEELIDAVLNDRGGALATADARAFAATGTGSRPRARRTVTRAARIGVDFVGLDVDSVAVTGRRARVSVNFTYELRGVRGSFQRARRFDAVRRDGRWRIRGARERRGLPPWEVADFVRRRSRHFVVLAPPAVPADELLPALESGYDEMSALLPRGVLRRRYLVVVAAGAAQARALTVGIRGVETLAAIADASIVEEGPAEKVTEVVAVRLLVNWGRFSALDAEQRRRVITHELTHAALAGSTSGRTPSWLVEGVALYVSGDARPVAPGADLAALSRPGAIGRLAGEEQAAAYAVSSAAAFLLAERHGRRGLLRLYDSFNDPSLRGRPGRRLTDRALRRELGTSLAELEAALGLS